MESRVSVGRPCRRRAAGGLGVTLSRRGGIGLLCIDHAPVNALSPAVVAALDAAVAAFEGDSGPTRCWSTAPGAPSLPAATSLPSTRRTSMPRLSTASRRGLEGSRRLVLAALGTAPRWAAARTGTGLPLPHRAGGHARRLAAEVRLGLLPGSLGSQRLPRACGRSWRWN